MPIKEGHMSKKTFFLLLLTLFVLYGCASREAGRMQDLHALVQENPSRQQVLDEIGKPFQSFYTHQLILTRLMHQNFMIIRETTGDVLATTPTTRILYRTPTDVTAARILLIPLTIHMVLVIHTVRIVRLILMVRAYRYMGNSRRPQYMEKKQV